MTLVVCIRGSEARGGARGEGRGSGKGARQARGKVCYVQLLSVSAQELIALSTPIVMDDGCQVDTADLISL